VSPNSRTIARNIIKDCAVPEVKKELEFLQSLLISFQSGNSYNCISVPMGQNNYNKGERLNLLHYSYSAVIKIVKMLEDTKYIVKVKGFNDPVTKTGRVTRVIPTDKLIQTIKGEGQMELVTECTDELVILRDPKGENIYYCDTSYSRKSRKFLMFYNSELAANDFKGCSNPYMYRVFNKRIHKIKFSTGGRFYCLHLPQREGYQNLSKEKRKLIKINGEDTVELDFSGIHLNLAYLMCGLQLSSEDPYSFVNYATREQIKIMSLIMINSKNETSAKRAFAAKYAESTKIKYEYAYAYALAKRLIIDFKKYHAPIEKLFCSDTGVRLQYHDSQIMADILKYSILQGGFVALPVHDSIIIAASKKEKALEIMLACYQNYTEREFDIDFIPTIGIK